MKFYIGLMSGTSMDGIDAVLLNANTQQLFFGATYPFSTQVKSALNLILLNKTYELAQIYQLHILLAREFATAVTKLLKASDIKKSAIIAIGSHGQTILHNIDTISSMSYTWQLGCPHTLSVLTGIKVVADFRSRDVALGGNGAPLAPLYHQELFGNLQLPVVIVNIGGIANLTLLTAHKICGYDIGPGNCLMDLWIYLHANQNYDTQGLWAAQGNICHDLLTAFLSDAYFHKIAPKSIGREYFAMSWLEKYNCHNYSAVDVQATLLQLTAILISEALKQLCLKPQYLLICGGGTHNSLLLTRIATLLPETIVTSTEKFAISPDFIEAQMIAWLAAQRLRKRKFNLKNITGSTQSTVLGVIY